MLDLSSERSEAARTPVDHAMAAVDQRILEQAHDALARRATGRGESVWRSRPVGRRPRAECCGRPAVRARGTLARTKASPSQARNPLGELFLDHVLRRDARVSVPAAQSFVAAMRRQRITTSGPSFRPCPIAGRRDFGGGISPNRGASPRPASSARAGSKIPASASVVSSRSR